MGGKAPSTNVTTTQEMTPEQRAFYDMAFPFIKDYGSKPLQQFQGTGVAGFTPEERAGQKGALDAAGSSIPGLATGAANAQAKLLDPNFMLDPNSNPFLKGAATNAADITRRELTESELPALRSGANVAGGAYSGGSTREGIAEGLATGRTNRAISDATTAAFMDQYNRGLGTMQQAIGMNPGVQAQQLFAPEVESAVGGQERAMSQAQLDEQIQKFYTGQSLPFLQGQELMSLIGMTPGGVSHTTGTGAIPGVNPFMAGIGGLGALGSLFSGIGNMGGSFGGIGNLFKGLFGF